MLQCKWLHLVDKFVKNAIGASWEKLGNVTMLVALSGGQIYDNACGAIWTMWWLNLQLVEVAPPNGTSSQASKLR